VLCKALPKSRLPDFSVPVDVDNDAQEVYVGEYDNVTVGERNDKNRMA